jgi:hypothetical protein
MPPCAAGPISALHAGGHRYAPKRTRWKDSKLKQRFKFPKKFRSCNVIGAEFCDGTDRYHLLPAACVLHYRMP